MFIVVTIIAMFGSCGRDALDVLESFLMHLKCIKGETAKGNSIGSSRK